MSVGGQINNHAGLIWAIADLLRGDYKPAEYQKVVLPHVLLRRLDCVGSWQVCSPTSSRTLTPSAQGAGKTVAARAARSLLDPSHHAVIYIANPAFGTRGLYVSVVRADITHLSIGLINHRLTGRYGPDIAKTYRVVGEPTVEDTAVLAKEDPFQFQAWALGLVGARVAGSDKRGGDKGIDGRLYFHQGDGATRQIVFSVKAGHLVPNYVRDLRGVIDREDAEVGVLLSFEEPSAGMRAEAAEAGFYTSPWGKHPRIQMRTVGELLAGKGVDYPHVTGSNVTLRQAQRAQPGHAQTMELFGESE